MHTWGEFEDKYWRQDEGWRFEFYPSEGRVVCFTDGGLLKTIHHIGACKLDIDWSTFKGRSFYIKIPSDISERTLIDRLSVAVQDLMSEQRSRVKVLTSQNWNNRTNKPLDIFAIRRYISELKSNVKAKKRSREDICKFFNQYNIEEDVERLARGADIMRVLKSKPSSSMIEEGKASLERMYKKGLLVKHTKEEYLAKMEKYGS